MSNRHYEHSWSIDPSPWDASSDDDLTTIEPPTRDSALQISSYRKRKGLVTDLELTDFVARSSHEGPVSAVRFGDFRGLTRSYEEAEAEWQKWWLAAGPLHLYVTYNSSWGCRARDATHVTSILNTLQVDSLPPLTNLLSKLYWALRSQRSHWSE